MAQPTDAEALADAALPRILEIADGLDFSTYLVGTRLAHDLTGADEHAQEDYRLAVRAPLLQRLAELWPGRTIGTSAADLSIVLLPERPGRVAARIASLFVAGRYRKLVRGMSQTVFHCRNCRGRPNGCAVCDGSGRHVREAVQDFVCPPLLAAAGGRSAAFHGCGREDVDVRMLGEGRPFVASVGAPRRRTIDTASVEAQVEAASGGRVTVHGLRVVDRAEMRRVTTEHGEKRYRAVIAAQRPSAADAAARLASLCGAEIRQRTPQRVERRADLVRVRRILEVTVESVAERRVIVGIRTEAGTYVKELVSGDDGRTEPSFALVLGQTCFCAELDVLYAGASALGSTL